MSARLLLTSVLVALPAYAQPSPEVQLCLQHLREGERARLERALGPVETLPLYRLQLDVHPGERRAAGRVQVFVTATDKALSRVLLRVTPNAQSPRVKLSHATVNGQPVLLEQPEPTLYRVRLDPEVVPGAAALVEVQLDAKLPFVKPQAAPLLAGMTGSSSGPRDYGVFSATDDLLSLVGVMPMVAPEDESGEPFPGPSGMGDLGLFGPSNVLASITVPTGWTALTSGVALGEVPEKDGRIRFSWAAAGVRDFPLIVARGYQKSQQEVGGVTVESWYRPENAKAGKASLKYAAQALTAFGKRLGPVPWKTFRVVEAPLSGGAGGMEFSGMITVSSGLYGGMANPSAAMGLPPGFDALLGGSGQFGSLFADTVEFTVAHEVAHQYFPMLVGSDPVREPFVDETLAQYLALLYVEWTQGAKAAEKTRQQMLVTPYHFHRLMGGEDVPAARPTEAFTSSTEYAAIVYGKAPLLHHEVRKAVGDAAFVAALKGYLDENRYRWACSDCFFKQVAKGSPKKAAQLERLRTRWWEETHGDEDLGAPGTAAFMEQLTGQKIELDPKTMELMQDILQQLSGSGP